MATKTWTFTLACWGWQTTARRRCNVQHPCCDGTFSRYRNFPKIRSIAQKKSGRPGMCFESVWKTKNQYKHHERAPSKSSCGAAASEDASDNSRNRKKAPEMRKLRSLPYFECATSQVQVSLTLRPDVFLVFCSTVSVVFAGIWWCLT